jgi:tape measure domain-containing protein
VTVDAFFSESERRANESVSTFDRISRKIGKTLGAGIAIGLGDVGKAVDSLINITEAGLKGIPVVGTALGAAFKESSGAMREAVETGFAFDDMMTRNRISLRLVAGGVNDYKKELQGLRGISSSSEFGLQSLVDSARDLQIMQHNARDVVSEIRAISAAAAALDSGESGLNAIASLFARISELGKVSSRDARQLVRQGIPLYDILGEALGESKSRTKRLLDSGRINSNDFIDILLGDFQKRYKGAAAQMAETVAVQNAKLATGMAALKGAAFQGLHDRTVSGLEDVNKLIRGPQAGTVAASVNSGAVVVSNLIEGAVNALKSGDLYGGALKAGESTVEGLKKGITSKAGEAYDTVKGWAQGVVSVFEGPEGIDAHSPSRKFEDLGLRAAAGFGKGFSEGMTVTTVGVISSVGGLLTNVEGMLQSRGSRSLQDGARQWSQEQIEVARTILRVAQEVGATEKQIQAAFAAANVESRFNSKAVGDSGHAFGTFQMWPSKGWGTQSQVLDPEYAARKWFEVARRQSQEGTPGQLAQRVEGSRFPRRYDEQFGTASQLLNAVRGSGPLPTRDDELAAAVRALAESTNWRIRGDKSPDEGKGRFQDLSPTDQLKVIQGMTGFNAPNVSDLQGGTGRFVEQGTTNPNAPIIANAEQPITDFGASVVGMTSVTHQALQPLIVDFNNIGDAAEGSGDDVQKAYERASKKLRGVRGELLELGITAKDIGDSFESQFVSAFDHVGEAGHNFARDLALGMLADIKHNIGVGVAGELRDAVFGTADGEQKGLLGKLGRLFGGKGADTTGAGNATTITSNTSAVTVNTSAEQTNTFALQNLTAVMSTAGKTGIADGALSGDKLSDLGNGIHNDLTALSDKSSADIGAAGKGVSDSVNIQGFNVTNAVKSLEQTMISITPRAPGLLGTILSAAIGGAVSGLTGGLLGGGSNDEGPVTGRPTKPPVLKRAKGPRAFMDSGQTCGGRY